MKDWSKSDLIGLILVVFGIISFLFSNSSMLSSISLLIASILLLNSVFDARCSAAGYHKVLCHYQAVLSSTESGWIAWNNDNGYVGSSKKLRSFFEIKHSSTISLSDIMSMVAPKDAENLSLHFNKLRKQGASFKLVVQTLLDNSKIEISGFRMSISGIETILLWCSNVTGSSVLLDTLEQKLNAAQLELCSTYEILEALPFPVWYRDSSLRIIYCNKAYTDYVGAGVEKVLQDNIPLVTGNLFGQGHSLAETAKKCNRTQSISHFVIVNGERRKVSMCECPTVSANFIGYACDITKEDSLASGIDRIITANFEVLENLSTAIVIFGENTKVIFFNGAYQRLMKLEPGWLHSKPTFGEVLDELRSNRQLSEQADYQAFKKSQLALFTSITAPTQELIHLPSGKTLRLMMAPYPLGGLLFVYEDVTDSLILQRKNNTLISVQKETINNLYEGVTVFGSDNRLKILNKSLQKIWNIADEETENFYKGIHISELLDRIKNDLDYGQEWESFREYAVSNLTDRISKTGKLLKKDGSVILFSYSPLPDGAHLHSFIDITDTFNVEKAMMEKNQALKTAQQLRFEFVSGISLELNEPLNVLIGFSELLLHQYFGALNDKQSEYCRHILDAANQLNNLINNLLEMTSIDIDSPDLNLSVFSMGELINEVIDSLAGRIKEKNIDIAKYYPDRLPRFSGDRVRIKQSLYSMLSNSIQFALPNGKIDVKLAVSEGNLKIIIKDNGIGFAQNEDKKPFKRLKKKTNFPNMENEGVSMPFVKSLIEQHGGTLKINSDIEEGTNIICTLPMKTMEAQTQINQQDELLEEKKMSA